MAPSTYAFQKVSFSNPRSIAVGTSVKALKWESFSNGTIEVENIPSSNAILIVIKQGHHTLLSRIFPHTTSFSGSNAPYRRITYTAKQAAFRYDWPIELLPTQKKTQETFQISCSSPNAFQTLLDTLRPCFTLQPSATGTAARIKAPRSNSSQIEASNNNPQPNHDPKQTTLNFSSLQKASQSKIPPPPKKAKATLETQRLIRGSQSIGSVSDRPEAPVTTTVSPDGPPEDPTSELKRKLLEGFKPPATLSAPVYDRNSGSFTEKDGNSHEVGPATSQTPSSVIPFSYTDLAPKKDTPFTSSNSATTTLATFENSATAAARFQLLDQETQIQDDSQSQVTPSWPNSQRSVPASNPPDMSNFRDLITLSPILGYQPLVQVETQVNPEPPVTKRNYDTSSGSYVTANETLERYTPILTDEAQRAVNEAKRHEDDLEMEDEGMTVQSGFGVEAFGPNVQPMTLDSTLIPGPSSLTLPYGQGMYCLDRQDLEKLVEDVLLEYGFETLCANVSEILNRHREERDYAYHSQSFQASDQAHGYHEEDPSASYRGHSEQADARYLEVEYESQHPEECEINSQRYERSDKRRRIDEESTMAGREVYDDIEEEDTNGFEAQ
ncbi:hypothetical protein IAR55_000757 [Kwoniella newhampshirensis]|uniref:Inheritance of peroxisomes protein 1 n=1 Tax=Kwoniella newhampshirensis TaxID=1651941 RepID=A0AAW0Z3Z8_9TREE